MAKTNNLKLTLCGAALAGLLLPSALFAGEETTTKETKVVEAPKTSAISGDFGVNFVSQYLTRGLVLENQGFIAQPYADIYIKAFEGDGFLSKVVVDLGIWSSLHSRTPADYGLPKGTTSHWFEFDWTPGISLTFAKDFTLTMSYFEFDSPNDLFSSARSLNVRLDYDDSKLLGVAALHPHITYLKEFQGKVGNGPVNHKGDYWEVGITPGLPAMGPVTITLPITAGFGTAGFYNDDNGFGYFGAGPNVAVSMPFIPSRFGTWTVNANATYYYLDGSLSAANAVQPHEHNTWVFGGGIGVAF